MNPLAGGDKPRVLRYDLGIPGERANAPQGLTHSLDLTKEGLMPNYTQPCSVDGCTSLVGRKGARGLCTRHYQRLLTTGSPTGTRRATTAERFWRMVDTSGDCWLWTGSQDGQGYGAFSVGGVTKKAHRFAYELGVGPIPQGKVIDHLCRNRACVNPSHMEPVTNDENLRRGVGRDVSQGRRNACRAGHPYSTENTYINPLGRKVCRTCMASSRARYEDRKAS